MKQVDAFEGQSELLLQAVQLAEPELPPLDVLPPELALPEELPPEALLPLDDPPQVTQPEPLPPEVVPPQAGVGHCGWQVPPPLQSVHRVSPLGHGGPETAPKRVKPMTWNDSVDADASTDSSDPP